ncbi:hypothetical protein LTR10_005138 [Elasticomyces elasticus]|nr:hypothetical protein LTR10_005138 [Elasticomyces elasticus]KAK4975878.1 hypothetical protein LTR42_003499 [Elasticomyces elasticus]
MARKKVWDVFRDGPRPPSPKSRRSRNNPQPALIIAASPTQVTSPESKNAGHDLNVQPFRLLDLPPELWIRIAQFALTLSSPNLILTVANTTPRREPQPARHIPGETGHYHQPAFTRTNRLLRAEGLPMFYRLNNVSVHEPVYSPNKWLTAVGKETLRAMGGFKYSSCFRASFIVRKLQLKDAGARVVVVRDEVVGGGELELVQRGGFELWVEMS